MICNYCKKELKNFKGLCAHLRIVHKENTLDYLKKNNLVPKCAICTKDARWIEGDRFSKTCSIKHQKRFCLKLNTSQKKRKSLSIKRRLFLKQNKNKHNWSLYRKEETEPERRFREKLSKIKIDSNIFQWYIPEESKKFFEIDFVLENLKIGFEINGNQHYCKNGELKLYYRKRQKYLESLGWKIINIHYLLCFNETKLNEIILSSLNNEYVFSNEYVKEVFRHKEIRNKIKQQKNALKLAQKLQKQQKQIDIKKDLILTCNIDFSKSGWVRQVSSLTGIISQKVTYWMKKNMFEFYKNKCFKRKVRSRV